MEVSQAAVAKAAILGGALAGVIDIGAACLINHAPPKIILQAIASGLLGLSAYRASWTIALGLVLQIMMSIVIAGIYAEGAAMIPILRRRPFLFGIAYGIGIFAVMNFIVVPLSAFAPRPTHVTSAWLALNLAAMLLFGAIVASAVSRSLSGPSKVSG
jgi:hypothetical protein